MQGYFSQLEDALGYPLELSKKTCYIQRSEDSRWRLKRGFPSTPDEAIDLMKGFTMVVKS